MSHLDQQHDARKKIYLSALALVTASAAINLSVVGIQQGFTQPARLRRWSLAQ